MSYIAPPFPRDTLTPDDLAAAEVRARERRAARMGVDYCNCCGGLRRDRGPMDSIDGVCERCLRRRQADTYAERRSASVALKTMVRLAGVNFSPDEIHAMVDEAIADESVELPQPTVFSGAEMLGYSEDEYRVLRRAWAADEAVAEPRDAA